MIKIYPFLKRLFDILLAFIGLIISLPFFLIVSLLIFLEDRFPIFYLQRRVGKDNKLFNLIKFRTMIKDAENGTGAVLASENDGRVTRVGAFLRSTALDELPQLINIFKGDMSFVGPRPERPEFVKTFSKDINDYSLRLKVRPGLTGIAQIYGSYHSSPREKLRYDLLYIKKMNIILDLKMIFLSFMITLKRAWGKRGKKIKRLKLLRTKSFFSIWRLFHS